MTQISGSQINFTTFLGFLHNWYFLSATPTFLTGTAVFLVHRPEFYYSSTTTYERGIGDRSSILRTVCPSTAY